MTFDPRSLARHLRTYVKFLFVKPLRNLKFTCQNLTHPYLFITPHWLYIWCYIVSVHVQSVISIRFFFFHLKHTK